MRLQVLSVPSVLSWPEGPKDRLKYVKNAFSMCISLGSGGAVFVTSVAHQPEAKGQAPDLQGHAGTGSDRFQA